MTADYNGWQDRPEAEREADGQTEMFRIIPPDPHEYDPRTLYQVLTNGTIAVRF